MSYGAIGATTAGASAARRRRMQQEKEEEEMTQYTREDLDDDWEFKIVRSSTGAFRKRETLDKLREEEARAGWVMLEKMDDSRVRFKRPRRAQAQDAYLPQDVDPYRTTYGAWSNQRAMMSLVAAGLAVFLGLGVALFVLASR